MDAFTKIAYLLQRGKSIIQLIYICITRFISFYSVLEKVRIGD